MKSHRPTLSLFPLTLVALAGCAGESSDRADASGALRALSQPLVTSDVAAIAFAATAVDCATGAPLEPLDRREATTELVPAFIPGGSAAPAIPFFDDSQHAFADHYFALPAGCYDLEATPLTEDGTPSIECHQGHLRNVAVSEGQTTEVMIINQCEGDTTGGLDTIAALNHPPAISDLTFDPSKFTCEGHTTVCASATDPDGDPVSFVWSGGDGAALTVLSHATDEAGVTTECVRVEAEGPADYDLTVTAYDMLELGGAPRTVESVVRDVQGDAYDSHASLTFPVHFLSEDACVVSCACPEGFTPTADESACEKASSVAAEQHGTTYRVCEGNELEVYGNTGARYPNGTVDRTNPAFDHRLNAIGVWACDGESTASGQAPVNEWIGFSTCLNVAEPGDYLIGAGADNLLRMNVDGNRVFELDQITTAAFNSFWIRATTLDAGVHTLELLGYNAGSQAAFGAEIVGPFPAGSLTDDAAMIAAAQSWEERIVFSTLDRLGGTFGVGEQSGWSCPDGYSVDFCGDAPVCSQRLVEACGE